MIPIRDANPTHRRPVVTIGLIVACIAVFLYELAVQSSSGEAGFVRLVRDYGLVPGELTVALGGGPGDALVRELATLITSMFLHGDLLHIGFNLLFLWIFGNNIEDRFGHLGFVVFYLAGGLVAAAAQVVIDPTSLTPVIGASGAIAAVLGAYLVLYPGAQVLSLVYFGLFFQLIRIPAIAILGLWFAIQVFSAAVSSGGGGSGGIALFAHIGGFLAGVAVGLAVRAAGNGDGRRTLRSNDGLGVG